MINQIKSILGDYQCRVNESKTNDNCYYVTHINKHPEDKQERVNKDFAKDTINLFKKARQVAHNHYFVDMNGINIDEIIRFSQYKDVFKRDFCNDHIVNLGNITQDIVDESDINIECHNGEWEYNINVGFDMLVFNAQEFEMYMMSLDREFKDGWLKELLDEEFQHVTKVVTSYRYKDVGETTITVEYVTTVKEVFMIHPEKYHVLVNTTSEVVK